MKESLITKLPTNELMNTSQKKKRKHRQVLDKLVLFLKCNQIHCFLCQSIPGDPHLAPICTHVPLSHRAAGAAGWVLAPGPLSPVLLPWLGGFAALRARAQPWRRGQARCLAIVLHCCGRAGTAVLTAALASAP